VASSVILAACSSSGSSGSSGSAANAPLATYHADNSRTGYSTDTTITPTNVSQLTQKWVKQETRAISAQATVNDGVVYWGDWNGIEHATTLNGKSLWSTSVGQAPKPKACPFKLGGMGVTSTATIGYANGQKVLWVGGGGGQLYALNASTGAVLWATSLGPPPEYVLWGSPLLYDGSIYEGVASWNDCPDIDGRFYRVNAATGAVQATFYPSVPSTCVGVGIWSSASADPTTNSIFVGTGPTYKKSNLSKPCFTPDEQAIIQLNPSTLSLKSRWALPKTQAGFDLDFGATPTLFSATTANGVSEPLVGAENKNGVYYAFDRQDLSAGPVWVYQAETTAVLNGTPCEDLNTISSSASAGPGTPVLVAGMGQSGSHCIGTLAALNPATGTPLWQVPLPGVVQGAVTEVPGLVAVGAGTSLVVLSTTTGATLFSFAEPQTGSYADNGFDQNFYYWAPPTISANYLFIGNEDGSFRAFGL
jgi:outer membrane protein assembly factor BamB